MQTAVIFIRDWIRTNGDMSEDGQSITYNCKDIEMIVQQAKDIEIKQHGKTWDSAIEQGEKRAWNISRLYTDFDDYYAETYGSKGSDETPMLTRLKEHLSNITTEQFNNEIDEIHKDLGITSSQTEISDEKIEKESWRYREVTKDMEIPPNEDWSNGAKWYREQLKNK